MEITTFKIYTYYTFIRVICKNKLSNILSCSFQKMFDLHIYTFINKNSISYLFYTNTNFFQSQKAKKKILFSLARITYSNFQCIDISLCVALFG